MAIGRNAIAVFAMMRGVGFYGILAATHCQFRPEATVMITRKPLAEIAIYSVAMPATVGLCLWVLLGPFQIDRYLSLPIPKPKPEIAKTATITPVPNAEAGSETAAVVLFPGDDGRLLAQIQIQGALIKKGYVVGPAGADGNDTTLTALKAFQSDHGLPVQPNCDQQCRSALGLPNPQ
jgi:hypothetical protein